jgi:drug/metabolite transporter (DMT)-like permease
VTPFAWVLISISLILQGALPVTQQILMQDLKHERSAVLSFLGSSSAAFVVLASIIFGTGSYSGPQSWSAIAWKVAVATVMYSISNLCFFQALRYITSAIFGLIFTDRGLVITATAITFLGEVFGWLIVAGMATIIASVTWATLKRPKKDAPDPHFGLGVTLALIGTLCFGIGNVIDASVIKTFEPASYLLYRLALPVLLVLLFSMVIMPRLKPLLPKKVQKFVTVDVKPADIKTYVRYMHPQKRDRFGNPVSFAQCYHWYERTLAILTHCVQSRQHCSEVLTFYARLYRRWLELLAVASCVIVSSGTFMWAYAESNQLSFLSGVHQLSLFFTIGFSSIKNKDERKHFGWYTLAAAVALGGVVMMRL